MIRAVGHSAQMQRAYLQPDDTLAQRCLQWLDEYEFQDHLCHDPKVEERNYENAKKLLHGLNPGVDGLHALLFDPRIAAHMNVRLVGYFMSMGYKDDVIALDVDMPCFFGGYAKEKVYVNKGNVKGVASDCVIINKGTMEWSSECIIVNYGHIKDVFGYTEVPLVLNTGTVRYKQMNSRVITPKGKLAAYIDKLRTMPESQMSLQIKDDLERLI